MESPSYEVSPIPQPVAEEDVINYSRLRLLALKTNPEAFGSTYEVQSTFTRERWRAVIDTKERFTIVARLVSFEEDGSSNRILREQWVGTASILMPEMIRAGSENPGGNESVAYAMVGMWVHPEHRRKGLGKRLIEVGMEWVRTQTEGMPDEARQVALEVHRHNGVAKALYDGAGFLEATEENCEDPSRIPMIAGVAKN
ncbi:hypothetical protein B0H10DRAFT_1784553 [Mycena sp. CBHHK59/15]|nr:hypothetical protein B0H10DRAFT_1784553 [Mycena sp. CBHHK59/15]